MNKVDKWISITIFGNEKIGTEEMKKVATMYGYAALIVRLIVSI